MFDIATKNKFRFESSKGKLTTEDLWDLSMNELNSIAKSLKKAMNDSDEDYIDVKKTDEIFKQKFDIVIHIIEYKKAESNKKFDEKKKAEERELLINLINEKKIQTLSNSTIEELTEKLKSL